MYGFLDMSMEHVCEYYKIMSNVTLLWTFSCVVIGHSEYQLIWRFQKWIKFVITIINR